MMDQRFDIFVYFYVLIKYKGNTDMLKKPDVY